MFLVLVILQAYSTPSTESVIILSKNISDLLVSVIQKARIISILSMIRSQLIQFIFNSFVNLVNLIVVKALAQLELELRGNIRILYLLLQNFVTSIVKSNFAWIITHTLASSYPVFGQNLSTIFTISGCLSEITGACKITPSSAQMASRTYCSD